MDNHQDVKTLYRFEEDLGGPAARCARTVKVRMTKWKVTQATPCGWWVVPELWPTAKSRWVSRGTKKAFARPTKMEALDDFLARKKRHIAILKEKLSMIEDAWHFGASMRASGELRSQQTKFASQFASLTHNSQEGFGVSMAVCERCKRPTGDILLLGPTNHFVCNACGAHGLGKRGSICSRCGSTSLSIVERNAAPPEYVSDGLCEECKAALAHHDALVRQGGVYWKCSHCGSSGVVRPGTLPALVTRHRLGIAAPEPCGMTVPHCPVYGEEAETPKAA
jgi:hypothetical protein